MASSVLSFCRERKASSLKTSSADLRLDRTQFVDHRGKRILRLDYTGLGSSLEQLQAEIEKTREVVRAQPPASLLVLTDVRNTRINPGNVRAMQELVKHNAPYVKWSAVVVGLTGVYLTAFRAVQAVARRRNMNAFSSPDEAMEWLVSMP